VMKIVAICERPRGSLRCAYRDRVLACERINFVGVRTEYGATARMVASVQTRYRAHEGLGCPIRYPGNATSNSGFFRSWQLHHSRQQCQPSFRREVGPGDSTSLPISSSKLPRRRSRKTPGVGQRNQNPHEFGYPDHQRRTHMELTEYALNVSSSPTLVNSDL
jgi:hypothetical protein